jgi:hypothetical protein
LSLGLGLGLALILYILDYFIVKLGSRDGRVNLSSHFLSLVENFSAKMLQAI